MTILHALILGLIEGVTEFLPVSSTAHLIIASKYLGLSQNGFTSFFEVFIQSGAILAVVVMYFKYILKNTSYISKLLVSFIPTAVIGLLLHDVIKKVFFNSTEIISWALILVGILFILVEIAVQKGILKEKKSLDDLTYKDAFIVGLFQSCAVVPGVSRAGAVIIGMICLRYKRSESAVYSFLLAIPTILSASALDFIKTDPAVFTSYNILLACIGFFVSFVSALVCINLLIKFLQKNSLIVFGIYRIILGLLI